MGENPMEEYAGSILAGPTWDNVRPGSVMFDALVKSVATSATRVGAARNHDCFMFMNLPDEVLRARDKLDEAQKLLLGAHALLADTHHVGRLADLAKLARD